MTETNKGFPLSAVAFVFCLGALFLGSGLLRELALLVNGVRATGVIESTQFGRRGSTLLEVGFQLPEGRTVKLKTWENLRWGYQEGEQVRIAYRADDYTSGEILSFPQMWFPLTLKIILGVLLFWGSYALWKRRER